MARMGVTESKETMGRMAKMDKLDSQVKKKYEEMLKSLTGINLSKVIELVDNTDLSGELACAGGACEIQ